MRLRLFRRSCVSQQAPSSNTTTSDLIAAYEFGANAYVVKPVDFAEFVKAFKQMIKFWMFLNVSPELDSQAGV